MTLLIEQPGVHDLPHHWAGDTTTGLAVFDHHRNDNLGMFGRSKTDEQGVVAVTLQGFRPVVALALLDRDYLCGTTLAGNTVLGADGSCTGNTARVVHHHLHAVVDLLPVTRVLEQDVRHRMFVHRGHAVDGLGQMRPVPYAFIGDQGRSLGQLQRRDLHIALSDTEDHGFTGEPRLTTCGALPGLRGHQPC